jgi:hypothetical protein
MLYNNTIFQSLLKTIHLKEEIYNRCIDIDKPFYYVYHNLYGKIFLITNLISRRKNTINYIIYSNIHIRHREIEKKNNK